MGLCCRLAAMALLLQAIAASAAVDLRSLVPDFNYTSPGTTSFVTSRLSALRIDVKPLNPL